MANSIHAQSAISNGLGFTSTNSGSSGVSLVVATSRMKLTKAMCVGSTVAAGWFLIYDSATVPVDGAVSPLFAFPVQVNGVVAYDFTPYPQPMQNGCVLVFSSTGPFTQTTNSGLTAQFMSAQGGGSV